MKFVVISDTHGQHAKLKLPAGDVLIHAGDISKRGHREEVLDFLNWFKEQPFQYKIFIAGNHDFFFEKSPVEEIERIIPPNIIYLNDSSTTIEGIKIWGSPITPYFFNWAFNRWRGEEISKHWDLIPNDSDIVITHGPAFHILDKTSNNELVGCEDLLRKLEEVEPAYHLCGHIHEAYGKIKVGSTQFINASVLNENYVLKNEPVVFDFQK